MVSVICNAYNHEKYIADALKSFVMQKTNFPFEVLVHDDASTDGTADIIREYEKKYPEIIKPIYQTENQYSKKQQIVSKIQYGRVSGKYIAFCEGDDYWTDSLKLQKQFDAMEAHPEVDMCAHAANVIDAVTNKKIYRVMPGRKNCIFNLSDVILGGGGFVATNSLFYRRELLNDLPEFRRFLMLDYTLQMHGAMRGGMLYLKDNMSVYRSAVKNSWTDRMNKDKQSLKKHMEIIAQMLNILDKDLDYKYTDTIQKKIMLNELNTLYDERDIETILKKPYRDFCIYLPLKRRIKIFVLGALKKIFG